MTDTSGRPTETAAEAEQEIRRTVEAWAVLRDSGDWERFRDVWHEDGWMTATWFQGPAEQFIEASRRGFEEGARIWHLLSGTLVDVRGERALAQTRMTIMQRGSVDGCVVDVECFGRFYDFFARRRGEWRIVRRQPIYERDRMIMLDPSAAPALDQARLAQFPEGYRHLAYLQSAAGFEVMAGLPGLTGAAVETLYREGEAWLSGSADPARPRA